ncbi:unnamed protein product [Sphagnum jensenii]|uniref:Uncharacterized protein n=1 Tax=Sphagnum jensenii TaxID=128206 RepID=A0ABP1AUL5_9BRYO
MPINLSALGGRFPYLIGTRTHQCRELSSSEIAKSAGRHPNHITSTFSGRWSSFATSTNYYLLVHQLRLRPNKLGNEFIKLLLIQIALAVASYN